MSIKEMEFTHEQVIGRYETFVGNFLSGEKGVKRTEVLPNLWVVQVEEKDFKVTIECQSRWNPYGFQEWIAVVEEPNGDKSNYLLFEKELEDWLESKRNELDK